jgi:hypothetical protein
LTRGRRGADQVFVNCPFDEASLPVFEAVLFAIHYCGFVPRTTRELDDSSQTRIEKLYALIGACRYGVHDLSRTELDALNGLPRFNMPLELGLFLGAKRFGDEGQQAKRCLIPDVEPYRYQKFASDLSGMDIADHGGDPLRAVERVRDWLANVSRRKLNGPVNVTRAYRQFLAEKRGIAEGLGFDPARIPYVDYEGIVTAWLLSARP